MSARKQTPEFHRGTVSPSSGSSSPRELLGLFEGGIGASPKCQQTCTSLQSTTSKKT